MNDFINNTLAHQIRPSQLDRNLYFKFIINNLIEH